MKDYLNSLNSPFYACAFYEYDVAKHNFPYRDLSKNSKLE